MTWGIEFAEAAERDLELILDHLIQSYQDFGDDPATAFERAVGRLAAIQTDAEGISLAPFQGTLRPDVMEGLRYVRHDRAVFWFVPDEGRQVVQVLAVFFGGQDHIRHMLVRLLGAQGRSGRSA